MITFKKQFDKLTEAYIQNQIKPYEPCACFVGTILNGNDAWCQRVWDKELRFLNPSDKTIMEVAVGTESNGFYTIQEIHSLEYKFLTTIKEEARNLHIEYSLEEDGEKWETVLFIAFAATLDLLKQIHESKGEIVDAFEFSKRQQPKSNSLC